MKVKLNRCFFHIILIFVKDDLIGFVYGYKKD